MKDAICVRWGPATGPGRAAAVGPPIRCRAARVVGAFSLPDRCGRGTFAPLLAVAFVLLLIAPPLEVRAQAAAGWDVSLMVDPFPPPFISDWEMNPQIASLTISRTSGADAWVTIHFMVTRSDGRMVVSARSEPQLVVAGIPTVINTGSAVGGSSEYDTSIEDVIARTARFPEDDYTACVVVADASGFVVADRICANFSTFYPDPPYLLFPMDGDTVTRQDLFFDWTPLQLPVSVMPRFVVQIAEIGVGQTPRQALTSNILHFENQNVPGGGFQYPLGEQSLNQGRRYAWWVQALDWNGMPLTSNDGRSEIWTFTLSDPDGGTPPGEEIGGSTHARLVRDGSASGPLVNFGGRSYEDMKTAFEGLPDAEMIIPLPIPNVGSFGDLYLSNVRLEWDDASTALAITATASLPVGSANLLLLADWDNGDEAAFSLGVQPVGLNLSEWGGGGDLSDSAPDLDGAVLTITSGDRTLDPALLPEAVGRLYGNTPIALEAGVALHHVLDLRDTEVGRQLAALGLEVSEAELAGTVALDPAALFAEVSEPPSFELTATLRGARLADTPEWLAVERYALRVTNDPALAFSLEGEAEAELGGQTLPFVLAADVGGGETADDVVFTGRMASSWDAPMGVEWLALDSVRLTLTVPQGDGPVDAVLGGVLTLGEQPVALTMEIEDAGGALAATFTARVDELDVGDLLAFAESAFGSAGFAEGIPDDVARLSDVSLVFRSGDPPTLTVLATANALGQSTELAYTLLPPGTVGDGAAGMLGLRLAEWSLSGLVPALEGTLADFHFPAVSFVLGPGGVPPPGDGDGDDGGQGGEAGTGGGGASWSIPWASFDPSFQAFLGPSYPCAGGTGCGGGAPGAPGADGGSSLSFRPGLNFSAPFSWAQISGAFGGLFGGGDGGAEGGEGNENAIEEEQVTVITGSPGLGLSDLLSGNFDLSGLDLQAVLPGFEAHPPEFPDWLVPTGRTLQITGDPEVRIVAGLVLEAELDGPKTFDLAAELTNAEGGGLAFEGSMAGRWEQPFGLEWLALDSVHMALSAGSVAGDDGPRVALGSVFSIGAVSAAVAMDVRGTSENRTVDVTLSARDLSTVDVVDFLNEAFDAGLDPPANGVALDSFSVAFNTGDDASFHLTGGFAAGMEPMAALAAVSALVPGVTTPGELPFEVGTMDEAWFDLHVLPDSVRGGFGGKVVAGGGADGAARFEGSAAILLGASRSGAGDDGWFALELDLGAHDLDTDEAIAALADAVPGEWALAEGLDVDVQMDSVRVRMQMDTRVDSASVELAGAGGFDGPDGTLDASLHLALFDVDQATWTTGALSFALQDVPVTSLLDRALALLADDQWALPDGLETFGALHLDSAQLTLAFDTRDESVGATAEGNGLLGEGAGAVRAATNIAFERTGDAWDAAGTAEFAQGGMTMTEALERVGELLPDGEWRLPDDIAAFDAVSLDSANFVLGFDTRDESLSAGVYGAGRYDEVLADVRLDFHRDPSDERASGLLTMALGAVGTGEALERIATLLPGDWALPADVSSFDDLALDSASLHAGFDTRGDSLWAGFSGRGRLGELVADARIDFGLAADEPYGDGRVTLELDALTFAGAFETIAGLLPGEDWSPPAADFDLGTLREIDLELGFTSRADSTVAWAAVGAAAWESPMGIDWLTLRSARVELTPPRGDAPARMTGGGLLPVGEKLVELTMEVDAADAGGVAATFAARVDELAVGDLLAWVEEGFGQSALADRIPGDVAALRDVSLTFRTGEPPTLTVLATATAMGQSTELAYTLLPPGVAGDGAVGMFGLRLADWSLSGLIPALSGTIADFRFPQVSFIQGPDGVPAPVEPGGNVDDPAAGGGWSIPWSSFDPSFLGFLEPSHPCAGGTGCGGGAPGEEDASAMNVRPGLNFSAPISWAQLSGAFGGLFGGGNGGNGDNGGNGGDADDASGRTIVRGSPGITLPDLFSGNLDLTGLLDLRAVLPPVDALPFGWPDWLVPTERALNIAGDPTSVEARMVFDAELDGAPRTFDLAADLTSAEGGGAEFEGTMRGVWEQPFGLDWLVLDSVHLALAAGSVGPRVALSSALEIGTIPAALALDVRGTSEDRVVHFTASARDLSTVDVVDFLNDAFGADLGPPLNPVTLDSFTVAFNTGEAASFHLTGGFSSDMEPVATLAALADLLPGVTAPAEVPFEIGTLGGSWFDLHVEPDSAWGGFGGEVVAGGTAPGSARLEGSASIRLGAARTGDGEAWMTLELDVAARELGASDAIAALEEAVPGDWSLPGELDIELDLDSVRVRLELDTRARTASADFAGAGRYAGPDGELDASLRLGLFDEDEAQWATGAVTLELQDVLVSAAVAQAAALLPGELALPAALDSVAPVRLDAASLTASFDSRTDSVTARLRGAGSLGAGAGGGSGGADGSAEGLEAAVDVIVTRVAGDSWAIGSLDARIGTISVPEALQTAATLFPGAAALPEAVEGLAPLVLDSAVVTLGFDTRSGTFRTRMAGASHLGEGQARLDGSSDIALLLVGGEHFANGSVTLGVRELPVTALLEEAGSLLGGGEWTMPEGLDTFGSLHLDSARLVVGFDTERDSVSAVAQGSGRLGDEAGAMQATADIAFARLAGVPGAAGSVTLTRDAITMTEALAQVAALLPGDWRLPDDLDAFDAVALDSARFELGFDSWADSLFAAVSGSGRLGEVSADARLDFLQGATEDRASGLLTLNVGQVGAGDAVEQIASLLPGEWNLPAGFSSFNALQLDDASLHAGFETGSDSLWAGFQGSGRLNELVADASLGFGRAGGTAFGTGLVTLTLGDVSLDEAFSTVTDLLPGEWPAPDVDFDIGDLQRVQLALGFDTSADSVWAGIDAEARLAERDGRATLAVVSAGGASGAARSSVTGTFRMDVGDVTLPGALSLASSLVPGSPQVPTLDFDLGGLNDAVVEAGFRVAERDSAWAGLNGGFRLGQRTGRADVSLALGEGAPEGRFTAAFDDRFAVSDVLDLLSGLLPGGGVTLPPLGPFDVGIDDALLTMSLGERSGLSFGGRTEMFGKSGDALFSAARIDGRTQFLFGVQVPDLGFGDIVPGLENPVTDALRLSLAALTLTNGEGRVESSELSPEERRFYAPMKGGDSDDFTMDFRPGLNLTGLLPLGDAGALKEMVDMLAPGASDLTLEGTLPLPGSGGGIRSLELSAALPPMAPPGKPAWFVEGQVALAITGRPSVGVAGAITLDVEGDTLTFDVESNIAIIPAGGVELSLAGGLSALHPWEGPLGIEWLTLNEIRLALGLSPIHVRLGFLGDAVIGSKDLRVALGTRLNLYTGVPTGVIVAGASEAGMSLGDVADFQSQVRGGNATLPVNRLPDMAIRDLDLKVATYADADIDVKAGITFKGALLLQLAPQGELDEFGRIELEIDREGIKGLGRMDAFSMGPVHFDSALVDLALTLPEQHLILRGGVTVDGGFAADIDLMMTRDSLSFASEVELFERFQASILARAGFDLANPTFQVHAEMSNDFSDEVLLDVFERILPVGRTSLNAAVLVLDGAEESLVLAEGSLDEAIRIATEGTLFTMNAALEFYRLADNGYRYANSKYGYHRSRCSWWAPGHCAARNYWAGVRSARLVQRNNRWNIYQAARAAYLNRDGIENLPPVRAAKTAMNDARSAFNLARLEVEKGQAAITGMEEWLDAMATCSDCPRPALPLNIRRASFDAALDGFWGGSSVQLDVDFLVFGEQRRFQAGFGGSVADLASSLGERLIDAIF